MLGLDFGRTNSAIAVAPAGAPPRLATFGEDATFRSILHVDPAEPATTDCRRASRPVRSWVETCGRGRLVPSIKAHLASRLFTTTRAKGAVSS
jgi:hypothetical protein